ncbi:phospholipase D family protein (plasmid) [Ensifer sp. D2-11]
MKLRDLYGNTSHTGHSIDFFELTAPGARDALLASPFYDSFKPVQALTARGCKVRLLVRLSPATTPSALQLAVNDPNVSVRYFTDRRFHAKVYVVDDTAMVGSANLTDAGMYANREVSIILSRSRDLAFEELPGIFDSLWDYADVLSPDVLKIYEQAFRTPGRPGGEDDFEAHVHKFIKRCSPPTILVGSDKISRERSFLQIFRRKYDEVLIPAQRRVAQILGRGEFGRPEFAGADPQIEIGRFLGWVRLSHGAGDSWRNAPILAGEQLDDRIRAYLSLWKATDDIVAGDMFHAEKEIENIERIRSEFGNGERLSALSYDGVFDTLVGCHAFLELLRFTEGGLEGLRADFAKRNKLADIKRTIEYLVRGPGDVVQRAYDCIFDPRYRLNRFGGSCVMELAGWSTPDRPPFNGRTIKGLRFLGFDVEKHT